ncbi:MAG: LETM1 domain-containing protein [Crocinitomicaceae bacterium]
MSFTPEGKGWIPKYHEMVAKGEIPLDVDQYEFDPEKNLYLNVHDTGLIYGYPTNFIFYPDDMGKWSTSNSYKLLLYEGFILSNLLNGSSSELDPKELIDFYETLNHKKAKKFGLFKGGGGDDHDIVDSLLSKRLNIKIHGESFWLNYLSNSFIYTDLILYHKLKMGYKFPNLEQRIQDIQKAALHIIIAATTSNGIIGEKEKAVFDMFLASSSLPDYDKNEIEHLLKAGLTFYDLVLPEELTWIVRRWFLEIALIVILADNVIDPKEQDFLEKLANKLEFSKYELDDAQNSIQSFILNNFEKLPYLTDKSEFQQIYGSVTKKVVKAVTNNKEKILQELSESKELVALIKKSTTKELSRDEKKKVRKQLGDLAKSIPALTVFMLPGGAILLPIVLKLLPNLLPSAFQSNKLEEEGES